MGTVKTLLAINLYEITGKEYGELCEKHKNDLEYLSDIMPQFAIDKNGMIIREEEYEYLNTIKESDEKILLFNAWTADPLLDVEISGAGLEGVLKDIDLRPHFENFRRHTIKDILFLCTYAEYLIVNLCFSRHEDYYGGGYEMELDIEVEGKLLL